jgi:Rgg/GadR/MutR family transcriptional activator
MYNQIGTCFSTLRKSKHIAVNQIIGSNISQSQYHRFIKNESDISFSKFLLMLDQINITLEEFVFIAFDKSDPLKKGMVEIKESFEKKDINRLRSLANEFNDYYFVDKQIKFLHMSSICECLVSKLENKKDSSKSATLKKYLLNVETWGHYELVLFNNTFFLYDADIIQILFNQAKKVTSIYSALFHHIQEAIKLHSNVILYFLERNAPELAIGVINNLKEIETTNEQVYEKLLIKYWDIVKEYLVGEKQHAEKELCKLLDFLDFIDNTEYRSSLYDIFNFIKGKYGK